MNKALLVYHKVDFDGVFSCCIARKALEEKYDEVELLGFTYGDQLPNFEEMDHDLTVMVDISFSPDIMKRLYQTRDCLWIDHHQTALQQADLGGYQGMDGLRRIGVGACELCWEFFNGPNIPVPTLIQYLSAYDVWDHARFPWDWETVPVQLALKTKYGVSVPKIWTDFEEMISPDYNFKGMLEVGQQIATYEATQFRAACKTYSFPITVNKKYRGVCILTNSFGSRIFESIQDQYDIYVTVNRRVDPTTGKVIFPVGMYAEQGRVDFSLAEYLQTTYGVDRSGGHACACGTSLNEEEFRRLIIDCEI